MDSVASPCVNVCRLDAASVCVGCGRHIDEIGAWSRASEDQKRAIVEAARRRRAILEAMPLGRTVA